MKNKKSTEGYEDWTRDDLVSATDSYLELCNELHELSECVPQKVWDKINDLVYSHFEP